MNEKKKIVAVFNPNPDSSNPQVAALSRALLTERSLLKTREKLLECTAEIISNFKFKKNKLKSVDHTSAIYLYDLDLPYPFEKLNDLLRNAAINVILSGNEVLTWYALSVSEHERNRLIWHLSIWLNRNKDLFSNKSTNETYLSLLDNTKGSSHIPISVLVPYFKEFANFLGAYDPLRSFFERNKKEYDNMIPNSKSATSVKYPWLNIHRVGQLTFEKLLEACLKNNSRQKSVRKNPRQNTWAYVFRKEGDIWQIVFKGKKLSPIKHQVGLSYILELIKNEGIEIHGLKLLEAGLSKKVFGMRQEAKNSMSKEQVSSIKKNSEEGENIRPSNLKDTYTAIDKTYLKTAKVELARLAQELKKAMDQGNISCQNEIEREMDEITRKLRTGTGKNGKPRLLASSDHEKARASITKAINEAIKKIATIDLTLSDYLNASISKGGFFAYKPDPQSRVDWHIQ